LDKAIQAYGGAGVSQDTPLAAMWAQARVLRIVDGPDEVHWQKLGRNESKRGFILQAMIRRQNQATSRLMKQYRVADDDGPTKALL
jgi:acyl-CoA dehydrogenase